MQEVESAGANSLCHQFVLLKTAVKYAEWRVMNITDRVVMPSGETIVTPREDSPVRLDDGSGSSGSAMQQGASSAESGSGGGVERSENPMSVTAL